MRQVSGREITRMLVDVVLPLVMALPLPVFLWFLLRQPRGPKAMRILADMRRFVGMRAAPQPPVRENVAKNCAQCGKRLWTSGPEPVLCTRCSHCHLDGRERIEELRGRASNARSRELQRLAEATGWTLRKGGKHGVMYSKPGCGRLPIPSHAGALVARMVHKILDKTEEGEHRGHGG